MALTADPIVGPDRALLAGLVEALDPKPHPYASDPVGWIEHAMGEFVWSKQREVLESLVENRFTSVRSAHSTGKSHIASRAAAWWQATHDTSETFIVTTAPTAPQVSGILWRYIKDAHGRADLDGYITMGAIPEWKADGRLIGWGRKPADKVDHEEAMQAFQGIHARYVLVVLDEADGIPEWLWNAVDTIATGPQNRVLAIGNPDRPNSQFARINRPGTKWNRVKIDAFCSPNYLGDPRYTGTDEMADRDRGCPPALLEQLVGDTFVLESAQDWGEDSPRYISKVLAEHPQDSEDGLTKIGWIEDAIARDLSGEAIGARERAALDVARTGKDEAVLGLDRGGVYRTVRHKISVNDTMLLVGWLSELDREKPACTMVVDADGLGAGVLDRALELRLPVSPFYAGRKALKPKQFVNRRSEQWWALRQLFQDGLVDIDGEDHQLVTQLASIRYSLDSMGRIKVESKEDASKRGISSPDRADAMMMCHAPDMSWSVYQEADPLAAVRQRTLTSDLLDKEM